jgi:hypothetical protein
MSYWNWRHPLYPPVESTPLKDVPLPPKSKRYEVELDDDHTQLSYEYAPGDFVSFVVRRDWWSRQKRRDRANKWRELARLAR